MGVSYSCLFALYGRLPVTMKLRISIEWFHAFLIPKLITMKKFILIALCFMAALSSYAYDFKDGDCYYTITSLSDLTVALTNSGEMISNDDYWEKSYVPCYSGDFRVPTTATYSDRIFTVTSIDGGAFSNCTLKTLTIPETILSATISGTIDVLIIEDSDSPIEMDCGSVSTIYMGRNFTGSPFNYNNTVKSVTFGDKVTYINSFAFCECPNLQSVTLSDNVQEIWTGAFFGCSNLTTIAGKGVTKIETQAFCDCTSLESFDFPNLKRIEDGDSQTGTLRWGAFQGCKSLRNVSLPQGLMYLGYLAFKDCEGLETATLPASLTHIGDMDYSYVFDNCPNLKTITNNSPIPIKIGESTFSSQTYINAVLKVPAESKEKYLATEIWNNFFKIEEDGSINDDVRTLTIEKFEGGTVECLGYTIGENDYEEVSISANIGDKVDIYFIPESGYRLSSVMVNDNDVTSLIRNNVLSITIEGNAYIEVSFKKAPAYLSIKYAESGTIKQEVSSNRYTFVIEPSEGWKLHTVMYNGEDITSSVEEDGSIQLKVKKEDSFLSITFESIYNDVSEVNNSRVRVYANEGQIIVRNAEVDEAIRVYNEAGVIIATRRANSAMECIPVERAHVYIVKTKNKTVKLSI